MIKKWEIILKIQLYAKIENKIENRPVNFNCFINFTK